jgi:hypothetical protein
MAQHDILVLQKEANDKYAERILGPAPNKVYGFGADNEPRLFLREYEVQGQRAAHTTPGAQNNVVAAGFTSTVQFMNNLTYDKNTGRLIHFWNATTNHVAAGHYGVVLCRYSLDGGETWSTPVVVANERSSQVDIRNCSGGWANGRLFIFYAKYKPDLANGYEKWQAMCMKYSDDGGDTFSDEIVVCPMATWGTDGKKIISLSTGGYEFNGFSFFGHIIDEQGILYQTYYALASTSANGVLAVKTVIARSLDNGLTWDDDFCVPGFSLGTGVSANNGPMISFMEPRLYKAGGGEYFMICRKDQTDNGGTYVRPLLLRTSMGISSWGRKRVTVTADSGTNTFTATNHGFQNEQIVRIESTGTIPSGLVAGASYYVRNVTSNTFQLYLLSTGGTVVSLGSNGTGTLTAILTAEIIPIPETLYNPANLSKNITHDGCTINLYGDTILFFLYTNRRTAKAVVVLARVDKIIADGVSAFVNDTRTEVFSYPSGGTAQAHGNGAAIAFDNTMSFFIVEQDQVNSGNSPNYFFRMDAKDVFKWIGLLYPISKFSENLELATGKVLKIGTDQVVGARQTAVSATSQEATANATDLATALTLLNSLKAKYNALQTSYAALITKLQAHGLIA